MKRSKVNDQLQLSFFEEVVEQVISKVESIQTPQMKFNPVTAGIKVSIQPLFKIETLNFGNVKQNVARNLQVIELVKSKSQFTQDEKSLLATYSGWGCASGAFDPKNDQLGQFNGPLKQLLNEQEYNEAQESVLNAYYTEPFVIRNIWKILELAGFKGGKILDPSAGIGHFTGCMPSEIRQASKIVMVEPDSISSSICNALYDENAVTVIQSGLEKTHLKPGFDLVISNIPFGNYRVNDPKFDAMKLPIHDYFFVKALDLVRDGGLVAFITSSGTLDKSDSRLRNYLSCKADLVTAIRLPSGTFSRMANTTVVTDIVILRKKPLVDDGKVGEEFTELVSTNNVRINQYFKKYDLSPNLIGEFRSNTRYSNSYDLIYKGDLEQKLAQIVHEMTPHLKDWYTCKTLNNDTPQETFEVPVAVTTGFFIDDIDRLWFADNLGKVTLVEGKGGRAYSRIEGLVRIKNAVYKLLEADSAENELNSQTARIELNQTYDAFVKSFGPVMDPANRRAFQSDNSAPLIWSLEYYDEETENHCKAEIFKRSTVSKAKLLDQADTVSDALALSYNQFGFLNLAYMAHLLKVDEQELFQQLIEEDLAFIDPETFECVDAQEYLSGNVFHKLFAANAAFKKDARFEKNITRLTEILPIKVTINEISIQLGTPWIKPEYVEQFVEEVMMSTEVKNRSYDGPIVPITHLPELAQWKVQTNSYLSSSSFNIEWGTNRMSFLRILEILLNQQQPVIYDHFEIDGVTKSVVAEEATLIAKEKAEKIQNAFVDWIKADETRAMELESKYNTLYNSTVVRKYSGSHLVIPGLNPFIQLRPAQLDTIWRGIVGGNVLQALAVGGGKTLTQIVTAMECKRLGLHQKPCLVVPNHMLEAFSAEIMRAYVKAKILVISKTDMETPEKRKTALMRVATGNWDLVVMTHSTFGKIDVSSHYIESYLSKVTQQFNEAISKANSNEVRSLQSKRKQVLAKIEKMLRSSRKDANILPFDQLGIDMLVVDEADLFKNLWFSTKKTRVSGLSSSASSRAFDMFIKTRIVFDKLGTNKRGLIFATATPISNTIAEMFIMQTYLQPDALKEHFVDQFDAWAANFGREVTTVEVSPSNTYRTNTRFCRFQNVPELMKIFRQVAEIRTKKMLNLPVPKLVGGKHIVVAAKPSSELIDYVQSLVERSEKIKEGEVDRTQDNMLCVTNDGRKAALDMRIIDEGYLDFPGSKVNLCVENVFLHWHQGKEKKLTQLVFSDLSTPKNDGFSVYADMRSKLIAKGVPCDEIAFAQDYDTDVKKASLHRKVRSGKIRILIGSTELMGFGTNVQDLLVAEHHLDAPWRPRDVEQRDGRIERQGNKNAEISIYLYVTEKSFDAYMWQTLENKAKFIEQIFEGGDIRTIEDVNSASLSCSEVKALASGNPLIIEKAGVDNEIAKLSTLKQGYIQNIYAMQSRINNLKDNKKLFKESMLKIESDIDSLIDIKDTTYQTKSGNFQLCEDLCRYISDKVNHIANISFDKVGVILSHAGLIMQYSVANRYSLQGKSGYKYPLNFALKGFESILAQLSELKSVPSKQLALYQVKLIELDNEMKNIEQLLLKPFEYEEKLQNLLTQQKAIDASLGLMDNDFVADTDCDEEQELA